MASEAIVFRREHPRLRQSTSSRSPKQCREAVVCGREIIMSDQKPEKAQWEWRYSGWTGIMYGPVPVGLIVAVILIIIYFGFLR